jgi:transcriptional regulator with XRE-family HTH domain
VLLQLPPAIQVQAGRQRPANLVPALSRSLQLSRVKFPTQPLREIAEKRLRDGATLEEIAAAMSLSQAGLDKIRHSRAHISPRLADRVACSLGLHLALLWPDEYAELELPESNVTDDIAFSKRRAGDLPPNPATVAEFTPPIVGKRQPPKLKPLIWVDDAARARMEAS